GEIAGDIRKLAQTARRRRTGADGGRDAGRRGQLLVADIEGDVDPPVDGEVERLVRRRRLLDVGGDGRSCGRRVLRRIRRLGGILRLRVREARDRERTKQTKCYVRQTQSHDFLQFQGKGRAPLPLREPRYRKCEAPLSMLDSRRTDD